MIRTITEPEHVGTHLTYRGRWAYENCINEATELEATIAAILAAPEKKS